MTTSTLEVYKGEALENITILTKDSLSANVDVSWATTANSIIEVKDKPGGTILTTLSTTDIVSLGTSSAVVKGDKFYALSNGDYFVKFTAKDGTGRTKVLTFYLSVKDV